MRRHPCFSITGTLILIPSWPVHSYPTLWLYTGTLDLMPSCPVHPYLTLSLYTGTIDLLPSCPVHPYLTLSFRSLSLSLSLSLSFSLSVCLSVSLSLFVSFSASRSHSLFFLLHACLLFFHIMFIGLWYYFWSRASRTAWLKRVRVPLEPTHHRNTSPSYRMRRRPRVPLVR